MKTIIYNLFAMIYSMSPDSGSATDNTTQKKFMSIISPDKILLNEKLMLGLMFTAMAMVLLTWTVRKSE